MPFVFSAPSYQDVQSFCPLPDLCQCFGKSESRRQQGRRGPNCWWNTPVRAACSRWRNRSRHQDYADRRPRVGSPILVYAQADHPCHPPYRIPVPSHRTVRDRHHGRSRSARTPRLRPCMSPPRGGGHQLCPPPLTSRQRSAHECIYGPQSATWGGCDVPEYQTMLLPLSVAHHVNRNPESLLIFTPFLSLYACE